MKFNRIIKIITPILLILAVACGVSLVMLCINGPRAMLFAYEYDTDKVDSPAYLGSTVDYGEFYVNDVVYLCDSVMAQIINENLLRGGTETRQIWTGEDGDLPLSKNITKTEIILPEIGEGAYIAEAAERNRPKYLIIALGISNGVRYCTEEQFKSYYTELISAIKEASPETKIILQSVLPVSSSYERKTQGISAEKIDRANGWIIEIAEEQNVKYLNTASCLKNTRGYLDKKYDSGDGLHLNTEGYLKVLEYIRTHGYK